MTEGWAGDHYLLLFNDDEVRGASDRYDIAAALPGYRVLGLYFWDDFIVQSESGDTYTLPAVPCDFRELTPFRVPDADKLLADSRFAGKVRWFVKPIKFGGSPTVSENTTWVTLAEHADLVRWWNRLYRDLSADRQGSE